MLDGGLNGTEAGPKAKENGNDDAGANTNKRKGE
jgi:hypothetical protein